MFSGGKGNSVDSGLIGAAALPCGTYAGEDDDVEAVADKLMDQMAEAQPSGEPVTEFIMADPAEPSLRLDKPENILRGPLSLAAQMEEEKRDPFAPAALYGQKTSPLKPSNRTAHNTVLAATSDGRAPEELAHLDSRAEVRREIRRSLIEGTQDLASLITLSASEESMSPGEWITSAALHLDVSKLIDLLPLIDEKDMELLCKKLVDNGRGEDAIKLFDRMLLNLGELDWVRDMPDPFQKLTPEAISRIFNGFYERFSDKYWADLVEDGILSLTGDGISKEQLRRDARSQVPLLWESSPRRKLLKVLPVIDRAYAINVFRILADSVHAPVRKTVVSELSEIDGDDLVQILAKMIADPDAEIRADVARAIGNAGGEASMPFIEQMKKDPDVRVRIQAARAFVLAGRRDEGMGMLFQEFERAKEEMSKNNLLEPNKGLQIAEHVFLALGETARETDLPAIEQHLIDTATIARIIELETLFTLARTRSALISMLGNIGAIGTGRRCLDILYEIKPDLFKKAVTNLDHLVEKPAIKLLGDTILRLQLLKGNKEESALASKKIEGRSKRTEERNALGYIRRAASEGKVLLDIIDDEIQPPDAEDTIGAERAAVIITIFEEIYDLAGAPMPE